MCVVFLRAAAAVCCAMARARRLFVVRPLDIVLGVISDIVLSIVLSIVLGVILRTSATKHTDTFLGS